MTPEAQQLAIAEACEWTPCTPPNLTLTEKLIYGDKWWRNAKDKTISCFFNLPDYLSDLNAMYEAELFCPRLTVKLYDEVFVPTLKKVCAESAAFAKCDSFYVSATAAQRAEAFLRTLNLWK